MNEMLQAPDKIQCQNNLEMSGRYPKCTKNPSVFFWQLAKVSFFAHRRCQKKQKLPKKRCTGVTIEQ